jgi:hypothetical protein
MEDESMPKTGDPQHTMDLVFGVVKELCKEEGEWVGSSFSRPIKENTGLS